jgi:putative (di)nucleoside polyphosphate hydrolase
MAPVDKAKSDGPADGSGPAGDAPPSGDRRTGELGSAPTGPLTIPAPRVTIDLTAAARADGDNGGNGEGGSNAGDSRISARGRSSQGHTELFLPRVWFSRWSERRQRLEALLIGTDAERRRLQDPQGSPADALVSVAREAMAKKQHETAWSVLLDARRSLVPSLSEDELEALVTALRTQIPQIRSWRGDAVDVLLPSGGRVSPPQVVEALRQLDEHHGNTHRRLRARRIELWTLATVLVVVVITATALLAQSNRWDSLVAAPDGLPADLVGLGVLFGAVGACLSALQRAAHRPERKVPDERLAGMLSLLRPVTGAASGLVVTVAAGSGALAATGVAVLLGAFAAGFSERYILRFVDDDPAPQGAPRPEAGPKPSVAAAGARPATVTGGPARYFRAGVGIVVRDEAGHVLLCERRSQRGAWQLPQGGIKSGETTWDAARRELEAETALRPDRYRTLATMDGLTVYELPADYRNPRVGEGQVHRWVAVRVEGAMPSVDLSRSKEFVTYRWVFPAEVGRQVADFRRSVYDTVLGWAATVDPPAVGSPSG